MNRMNQQETTYSSVFVIVCKTRNPAETNFTKRAGKGGEMNWTSAQGHRQGGFRVVQLNHLHFNDIHIQIFATTQLASFPGSPHVACFTLVHFAQN